MKKATKDKDDKQSGYMKNDKIRIILMTKNRWREDDAVVVTLWRLQQQDRWKSRGKGEATEPEAAIQVNDLLYDEYEEETINNMKEKGETRKLITDSKTGERCRSRWPHGAGRIGDLRNGMVNNDHRRKELYWQDEGHSRRYLGLSDYLHMKKKWPSPQGMEEQALEMDDLSAMKVYRLIGYAKINGHMECSFV